MSTTTRRVRKAWWIRLRRSRNTDGHRAFNDRPLLHSKPRDEFVSGDSRRSKSSPPTSHPHKAASRLRTDSLGMECGTQEGKSGRGGWQLECETYLNDCM